MCSHVLRWRLLSSIIFAFTMITLYACIYSYINYFIIPTLAGFRAERETYQDKLQCEYNKYILVIKEILFVVFVYFNLCLLLFLFYKSYQRIPTWRYVDERMRGRDHIVKVELAWEKTRNYHMELRQVITDDMILPIELRKIVWEYVNGLEF